MAFRNSLNENERETDNYYTCGTASLPQVKTLPHFFSLLTCYVAVVASSHSKNHLMSVKKIRESHIKIAPRQVMWFRSGVLSKAENEHGYCNLAPTEGWGFTRHWYLNERVVGSGVGCKVQTLMISFLEL